MEVKEKLLNCPFCGGKARATKPPRWIMVYCLKCGAETALYRTIEEAITAWNTRANKIAVGNGENYEVVQR